MAKSVADICKDVLMVPGMVASCNGFLQEVADRVGKAYSVDICSAFDGNADKIRSRFNTEKDTQSPFHFIGPYPNKATQYAADGQFVVGGLTSVEMTYIGRDKKQHKSTMGHVVVVVPGGPSAPGKITLADGSVLPVRGGYPYCYQGAAHAPFRFTDRTQVDAVFPALKLPMVIYAYIDIQKTGK